jgi:hypothetical protein
MTLCDYGTAFIAVLNVVAWLTFRARLIDITETLNEALELLETLRTAQQRPVDFEEDLAKRLESLQRARFSRIRMHGDSR